MHSFPKNRILMHAIVTLGLLLGLFYYSPVHAAQISIEGADPHTGSMVQVDVTLDTQGEYINAIEGRIIYPENLLRLQEIVDGGSIINLWVERPALDGAGGDIVFSGITPGGFSCDNCHVFSLLFSSARPGASRVDMRDVRVLLNDGLGTEAQLTVKPYEFSASDEAVVVDIEPTNDSQPPNEFVPIRTHDPMLYDDDWLVVFATQDRHTGISHYEVAEDSELLETSDTTLDWRPATSPYRLADQNLESYVYVKAEDKAGNTRIATLAPDPQASDRMLYMIALGLIISGLLAMTAWILYTRKKPYPANE